MPDNVVMSLLPDTMTFVQRGWLSANHLVLHDHQESDRKSTRLNSSH